VRIAVLMTSYNRCDITLACLRKLFVAEACSSNCSIKVFLVDDASSDGTGELVKKIFPQVNVIS
jgi:GT2 family glycosyltransferase